MLEMPPFPTYPQHQKKENRDPVLSPAGFADQSLPTSVGCEASKSSWSQRLVRQRETWLSAPLPLGSSCASRCSPHLLVEACIHSPCAL